MDSLQSTKSPNVMSNKRLAAYLLTGAPPEFLASYIMPFLYVILGKHCRKTLVLSFYQHTETFYLMGNAKNLFSFASVPTNKDCISCIPHLHRMDLLGKLDGNYCYKRGGCLLQQNYSGFLFIAPRLSRAMLCQASLTVLSS